MGSSSFVPWDYIYIASSLLTNIGHGLLVTVMGPTQPYLAQKVDVEIDTINYVWTFGFFGYLVGSLGTGFIFERYLTKKYQKLVFLWANMFVSGAVMIVLPFCSNFGLLVAARLVQNITLGAYITADISMFVYTMGPIRSRPFTLSVHAAIGVGFLAGTFLVRPFLPEVQRDRNEVCNWDSPANVTTIPSVNEEADDYLHQTHLGILKLSWPFLIAGVWCIAASVGYLILAMTSVTMPHFYDPDGDDTSETQEYKSDVRIVHWRPLLLFVFFYYIISCGIERIYQPMAYTYGLCGPLELSPAAAVTIDSSYNGGFMSGRLVSPFVGKLLRPRNMIFVSLFMCIVASIVLVTLGPQNKYALYVGTGLLGFFVSWQFGACFSWIAQKGKITGKWSSIFFIGCGVGGMIFPPVSGAVFRSRWGPNSILYLTLIFCVVQCIMYATMYAISRKKIEKPAKEEIKM